MGVFSICTCVVAAAEPPTHLDLPAPNRVYQGHPQDHKVADGEPHPFRHIVHPLAATDPARKHLDKKNHKHKHSHPEQF